MKNVDFVLEGKTSNVNIMCLFDTGCNPDEQFGAPLGNAWDIRREFFAAASSLSGMTGRHERFLPKHDSLGINLDEVTFARWRTVLVGVLTSRKDEKRQKLLQQHPALWHWYQKEVPMRLSTDGRPQLSVFSYSIIEAVIHTIKVDLLARRRFGVCGRHDCPDPVFERRTAHKQLRCSRACTNLVSTRKHDAKERSVRAAEKKALKEAKVKGTAVRKKQRGASGRS